MIIPTVDIVKYEGQDWKAYLKDIMLYDVFEDVVSEYRGTILTGIMRYIIHLYSIDSNKIILNQEWLSNKKKIFNFCELPVIIYEDIVLLKSDAVRNSITKWLDFQNLPAFSSYMMYNDLIAEMRIAANSPMKKGITKDNPAGVIDYEAKMRTAEYVGELLILKAGVEQNFLQNSDKLREAYKELSSVVIKKEASSFGVETFLKQIKN